MIQSRPEGQRRFSYKVHDDVEEGERLDLVGCGSTLYFLDLQDGGLIQVGSGDAPSQGCHEHQHVGEDGPNITFKVLKLHTKKKKIL